MLPTLKKISTNSGISPAMELLNCIFCHTKQDSYKELQNHYITYHKLTNCMNCSLEFSKLGKTHFKKCKPFKQPKHFKEQNLDQKVNENVAKLFKGKFFCCLLCFYSNLSFDKICKHYVNKHHLKCKPVEKPDFEQVLRRCPYTLERYENYPYKDDNRYDIVCRK